MPCRRSRVRVPSSAPKSPASAGFFLSEGYPGTRQRGAPASRGSARHDATLPRDKARAGRSDHSQGSDLLVARKRDRICPHFAGFVAPDLAALPASCLLTRSQLRRFPEPTPLRFRRAGRGGRVVRQRPAKPRTAVRIRSAPLVADFQHVLGCRSISPRSKQSCRERPETALALMRVPCERRLRSGSRGTNTSARSWTRTRRAHQRPRSKDRAERVSPLLDTRALRWERYSGRTPSEDACLAECRGEPLGEVNRWQP